MNSSGRWIEYTIIANATTENGGGGKQKGKKSACHEDFEGEGAKRPSLQRMLFLVGRVLCLKRDALSQAGLIY